MKERPLWEQLSEALRSGLPQGNQSLSDFPLSMLSFHLSSVQADDDADINEYTGLGVFDVGGRAVAQALIGGQDDAAHDLWTTLANGEHICKLYGTNISCSLGYAIRAFIQQCAEWGTLDRVVPYMETMAGEQRHKSFAQPDAVDLHLNCINDAHAYIAESVLISETNKAQLTVEMLNRLWHYGVVNRKEFQELAAQACVGLIGRGWYAAAAQVACTLPLDCPAVGQVLWVAQNCLQRNGENNEFSLSTMVQGILEHYSMTTQHVVQHLPWNMIVAPDLNIHELLHPKSDLHLDNALSRFHRHFPSKKQGRQHDVVSVIERMHTLAPHLEASPRLEVLLDAVGFSKGQSHPHLWRLIEQRELHDAIDGVRVDFAGNKKAKM